MKKKYKYLFLSSIVIGNLVTSPVFALTGETSTNETTVSETTPTMENLVEETTKIPSSEETTSSSTVEVPEGTNEVESSFSSTEDGENEQETTPSSISTDTSSTETSQTENNKETRNVTSDGNWNYHLSGNYAVLDSYVGSSKDVVVPNEIDGKPTEINLNQGLPVSNSNLNKTTLTSIVFSNANNNKVKCIVGNGYVNFVGLTAMKSIDIRGLDMLGSTKVDFQGCPNLQSVNMENVDVSTITSFDCMFKNDNSLQTVKFGNLNATNVTDTSYMFYGCINLVDADLSNVSISSKLNTLEYMFGQCGKLTNIDMSKFDTSNVTNMDHVFSNCNSLSNLNISTFKTSKVTTFSYMFGNCYKLSNLDLKNFDTSNADNFQGMFSECTSLKINNVNKLDFSKAKKLDWLFYHCTSMQIIDLSNTTIPLSPTMSEMFAASTDQPLLVKATDPKLLNYNYASDSRVPIGPSFNGNGGHFSDNSTIKYYFEKCALKPTDPKFQISTFNNYKNTVEKPIKDGSLFYEWKLTSGTEPTQNDDLLNSNIVYSAQWLPSLINDNIPSQNVDNVKPNQSSIFGIAYMPKAFNFGSITLQDSGTQTIPLASGDYHIAVRDQRMNNNNDTIWKLEARLSWDQGKELSGAELITTNPGEVKKNINDGTSEFKDSDLISCAQVEAAGFSNVAISSTPNTLMVGRGNIIHNAVYDYNLGEVTLKIPETKSIESGNYSGNIEWNLSFVP